MIKKILITIGIMLMGISIFIISFEKTGETQEFDFDTGVQIAPTFQEFTQEAVVQEEERIKAEEEKRDEFQAPLIPKPPTLPGIIPTEEKDQRTQLTQSVLPKIAVNMVGTVSIFALLFLIISGVRFVTAYGNDENIDKAKRQATYAVVGLLIALLAYTIVTVIVNFRVT